MAATLTFAQMAEALNKSLLKVAGNAGEAFETQIDGRVAQYELLKPFWAEALKAWKVTNASRLTKKNPPTFKADTFNAIMVERAVREGGTWEHGDDQIKGIMAFGSHASKTKTGYVNAIPAGQLPNIDSYTAWLIDVQGDRIDATGTATAGAEARKATARKRTEDARKSAFADYDVTTFIRGMSDADAKKALLKVIASARYVLADLDKPASKRAVKVS